MGRKRIVRAVPVGEIEQQNQFLPAAVPPLDGKDFGENISHVQPLKVAAVKILLPQGGAGAVKGVQALQEDVEAAVNRIVQQIPAGLALLAPFHKFGQLVAHKGELFARVKEHVAGQAAQLGKLLLIAAPEFVDNRLFAVHHLVVGEGKDVVFLIEVAHREEEAVFHPGPLGKGGGQIVQRVVHPAEIPLIVKAQPAVGHRCGHLEVVAGVLRNQHHLGVVLLQGEVGAPQKPQPRFVEALVLAAALVDQIGDRVVSDAVEVVDGDPEIQGRAQKAQDVRLCEVEQDGAPWAVPQVWVIRLVQAGAVKAGQRVIVRDKVGRNKVQNHPDAGLMASVDQRHQLVRGTVAAGGGKVAGYLISPGGVQWVLGEGQQLDVGVAHLPDVGDELVGQLVILEEALAAIPILHSPGTGVQLVDVERAIKIFLPGG